MTGIDTLPLTDTRAGVGRRAVLKAAAWSAPVIAIAAATPLAAASTETPLDCTVIPVGVYSVAGGTLVTNGVEANPPTVNGWFGTGWTPAQEPGGSKEQGYTQTDGAVAPTPAGWWQGGGEIREAGFLSLDDHDNSAGASTEPITVTLNFAAGVTAGTVYEFALPVFASASGNGAQYLDVSISGAGVNMPLVVTGAFGNRSITTEPAAVSSYPNLTNAQTPMVTVVPTQTGTVYFTYTFTVPHVHSGNQMNADMLVQAPQVLSCTAA